MAISRSENMRRIRSKNTLPELAVRGALRELGYPGYRLHRRDLPGKPDIVFVGREKAIFVHGCFWHGHNCKEGRRKPKSNQDYWLPKIKRTRERGKKNIRQLHAGGWRTLVIWECEIKDSSVLSRRLLEFMIAD